MRYAEFEDPRLVEVYDATCPWSRDDDFFVSIVEDGGSSMRVLDLGCGTGRLALGFAARGHTVTGVDPAPASLAAARDKPSADRVTWIEGTSRVLPDASFDAAVMTSHVAQFFVTDAEWAAALADLHRALVPDGRLTFDARDPADRAWERWPQQWDRTVALPSGGTVAQSVEVARVDGDIVSHTIRYRFDDGTELASDATLRFRSEADLRRSLEDAGFTVEHVFGGWDRQPVGAGDGELLVVATT
jgi:ubiquinone/menaquinone biosynthesis C-methylase UbiE